MVEVAEPRVTDRSIGSSKKASPHSSGDVRTVIPPLGLREYWYPALEDGKVKNEPVGLKMLGEDLVFFRGKDGKVAALWNVCPHRGGSLMHGDCHYTGTVSCPYHGWTFDGDGNVLAVLPEGPDSKIPGKVMARKFPTITLKGMVFVWMGEGEPADPEEDIPPEFFDDKSTILFFDEMWDAQWNIALENGGDAHVPYVHRDSYRNLLVPSSPFVNPSGSRQKLVDGRAVISTNARYTNRQAAAKEANAANGARANGHGSNGNGAVAREDARMSATRGQRNLWRRAYFPALNGYWPKHSYRNWWAWVSKPFFWKPGPIVFPNDGVPEEWRNGHHLPGIYRGNRGNCFYSRECVPVTENTSRQIYYKAVRPGNWLGMVYEKIQWKFWGKLQQINFSHQDISAVIPQRYDTAEHLSATDMHQVFWRRLVLQARGMGEAAKDLEQTSAERFSYERMKEAGVEQEEHIAN